MVSLWDILGLPSTKVPIDVTTFISYVLPPMVCCLVVAVLAVTPQTRTARVALWPIVALLALRAVVSVDMSLGQSERKILDALLAFFMFHITTRTLDWTLTKEPLVRHLRPANSSPSTIMDALDLVTNLRGHGWNWSLGMHTPHETRPTNRIAFAFCALHSAVVHAFVCGIFHRAILSFAGVGSISERSTIIDETLSFFVRYLRASIISVFTVIVSCTSLQMGYDLCTILAVLFLGQDPAQWPPAFDAPWRATSLHEYWGRRWQQWFRRTFLFLAGYPFSIFFGRVGIVFGAFLASAVMHDIVLVNLDSRIEFGWMLVGFGMMAPGLLAEQAFRRLTGKKVDGVLGRVWTMVWLLLLYNVMTEGFARAGGLGHSSLIDSVLPVRVLVERLVTDFDVWLHAN